MGVRILGLSRSLSQNGHAVKTGDTSTPDTKHQQQYHSSISLLAEVLLCGGCLYHAPTRPPLGIDSKIVSITGTGVLPFCRMQLARFSDDEPSSCKSKFKVPANLKDPVMCRICFAINLIMQNCLSI